MSTKREELLSRIYEIIKISTIPSILKKISEVTEDSNSSVSELERVIEHDQSIAARVVGISNSVYYGFPRKINSISQAILVLGFEMVKGLAISTAVFDVFDKGRRPDIVSLWRHSFEVAMGSVLLAEKSGGVAKDSAFLAGLLHDIGRPILYQIFGRQYLDVLVCDAMGLLSIEEETFGAAHPEAGSWFADRCKLPESCVNSIRFHHNPELYLSTVKTGKPSPLVPMVYLADLIISEGNDCSGKCTIISPRHSDIMKAACVDNMVLHEVAETVKQMSAQLDGYFN